MSDASDIVDAVLAHITAAVSGVTTLEEVVQPDERPAEDFPLAMILRTEYEPEPLDWLQENRTWTVAVALWQAGGTRAEMETKLEAIRDRIVADPTLGGASERSIFADAVPESHPDDSRIGAAFVVRAEKVA